MRMYQLNKNVAETRPMRLPLYVGVPSMSPHYAASATATEIAEKYLRDNDNVMFEGSVSSVAVSNNLIDAMKILRHPAILLRRMQ